MKRIKLEYGRRGFDPASDMSHRAKRGFFQLWNDLPSESKHFKLSSNTLCVIQTEPICPFSFNRFPTCFPSQPWQVKSPFLLTFPKQAPQHFSKKGGFLFESFKIPTRFNSWVSKENCLWSFFRSFFIQPNLSTKKRVGQTTWMAVSRSVKSKCLDEESVFEVKDEEVDSPLVCREVVVSFVVCLGYFFPAKNSNSLFKVFFFFWKVEICIR